MGKHNKIWTITAVLFCINTGLLVAAPDDEEVKLGMSTALTGPASALGQGVLSGTEACFAAYNREGGIHGRIVKTVALDDGYEPTRTRPNMQTLLQDEEILAVIGNVGTPTATVSVPLANSHETLLFGAFTGAGLLRQTPPDRYIVNYRASYAEETAVMVSGLLQAGIEPTEIAFFTQDDGYGRAGFVGAVQALQDHGFTDIESLGHGKYQRNTSAIETAVDAILDHDVSPRAVIMVGAYVACAKFIREVKPYLPGTHFLNVSFVGSSALLTHLGADAEGVIVTQVVPDPTGDLPLVREYRENLRLLDTSLEPSFVSLEGYLIARIFAEGLLLAGPDPDRESIIDALENIHDLDLGLGQTISFDATDHQASHTVWPTVIQGGKYVSLDWKTLRSGATW